LLQQLVVSTHNRCFYVKEIGQMNRAEKRRQKKKSKNVSQTKSSATAGFFQYQDFSQKMRDRLQKSSLCDAKGFSKKLEQALFTIWDKQ
jgi:hypothetical protein